MKNNIRNEIQKISVPKDVHTRVKLGAKKAALQRSKHNWKRSGLATAAVGLLTLSIFYSPIGEALYERFFTVTQFEETPHNESPSIGYSVSNSGTVKQEIFNSSEELKQRYNMSFPLPQNLLDQEDDVKFVQYFVNLNNNDEVTSIKYILNTAERRYDIHVTNNENAIITFSAETTDGTATEKDVTINGTPSKLLRTNDLDGYALYMKYNGWQIVLSVFEGEGNLNGVTDVKEDEVIKLAESIEW